MDGSWMQANPQLFANQQGVLMLNPQQPSNQYVGYQQVTANYPTGNPMENQIQYQTQFPTVQQGYPGLQNPSIQPTYIAQQGYPDQTNYSEPITYPGQQQFDPGQSIGNSQQLYPGQQLFPGQQVYQGQQPQNFLIQQPQNFLIQQPQNFPIQQQQQFNPAQPQFQSLASQSDTSRENAIGGSFVKSEGYPSDRYPEVALTDASIIVVEDKNINLETKEPLQQPNGGGQVSASYNFGYSGTFTDDTDYSLVKKAKVFDMFAQMRNQTSAAKVNLIQKTYDPYRIPPDWDMVEEHQQAVRVARPRVLSPDRPIDVDEMSGRPIYNDRPSICCKPEELAFLGPCYPMYFQFLVFTWGILGVFILTTGLFSLISNYLGDFCNTDPLSVTTSNTDSVCPYLLDTRLSLANSINNPKTISVWQVLNLLAYLGCVVVFQIFRYKQRKFAAECDERELSAADFTVEVKNIPTNLKDVDIKQELKDFMTNHALNGRTTNVQNVVLSFDVSEKMKITTELEALTSKHAQLSKENAKGQVPKEEKAKGQEPKESIDDVKQKITELKDRLRLLQSEYEKGSSDKFLGKAFVTVNTQQEVRDILEYWKRGTIRRAVEVVTGVSGRLFHGSPIIIERADEPSDIFWENLGVPLKEKLKRRLISISCSIVALAISFMIVLLLSYWKFKISNSSSSASQQSYIYVETLSTLSSLIIVIINMILASVSRSLTLYEKFSSWTNFYISEAEKQTWAMFFNTSLITFSIYAYMHNYWGNGGMIKVITEVFIFNAFYSPIYNFINPFYLLKKYSRFKAKKLGDESLLTQKQANIMFEDIQTDFALMYSAVMKNMFTAAFYAPIVPSALFWTLLGNLLVYWVDKYNITQRGSITKSLGPKLAMQMTELLEWFLIIYAVGNVTFNYLFIRESGLSGTENFGLALPLVVVGLAVLNAALPMAWINEKLFGEVNEPVSDDTYESLKLYLEEDYDRSNPATAEKAIDDYSRDIQSKGDPAKYYAIFLKKYQLNQPPQY